MRWVPTFAYNDGAAVDVAFLLPIGQWLHRMPVVGGDIESDAAFPAAFVVRRDYQLAIPIRIYEEEWAAFRALVEYGQTGGVITWFPDLDSEDSIDVYLDSPKLGEELSPEPDGNYPRALNQTIVIRRVDGLPWDMEYFGESA